VVGRIGKKMPSTPSKTKNVPAMIKATLKNLFGDLLIPSNPPIFDLL